MKNTIIVLVGALILISEATFTSCESSAQKVDNAKVEVQDAKQNLKDAQYDATVEAKRVASAEEWKTFKAETDVKIEYNETRIAELKAKMKTSGKTLDALYSKSVDALEQRNKELKMRMDNYEKGQTDWEKFKTEFNHDLEGLGQAFTDLTVNNKK